MKKEHILDAMNEIDDDIIASVEEKRQHYFTENKAKQTKKIPWMKRISQAAGICLLIGAAWAMGHAGSGEKSDSALTEQLNNSSIQEAATHAYSQTSPETKPESSYGVYIPPLTVDLSRHNAEADMLAFFIYEGHSYVEYERISEPVDFIGEYLDTATGSIDEWTSEDDYIELSGSIGGDFYEVKGFDPFFMLCMKWENGDVSIFINDNDLYLTTGADLFETRLHLGENYTQVLYQTREDWYHGNGDPIPLSADCSDVITRFVQALNEAPFMNTDEIPLEEGDTTIYDREIYHLFFSMENGMTIQLRLYEGGYVRFQGLLSVCVKVEEESFEQLIGKLE